MQKTSHQRRMLGAQQSPGRVVLTEQVQGSVVESQKCTIDFWWNKCRWKRAGFEAEVKVFSPFISIAFFPFSIPWCSNFWFLSSPGKNIRYLLSRKERPRNFANKGNCLDQQGSLILTKQSGITVECPSQSGIGLWRIAIKGDSLDRVFSLYGRFNA